MFDPLSNFKLNKILSAVNALPTTLSSSFTEVKNAIAGVQNTANTINTNVNTIDTNVGDVSNDLFYIQNKIIPTNNRFSPNLRSGTAYSGDLTTVLNLKNSHGVFIYAGTSATSNSDNVLEVTIDGVTIKIVIKGNYQCVIGSTDFMFGRDYINHKMEFYDSNSFNFTAYSPDNTNANVAMLGKSDFTNGVTKNATDNSFYMFDGYIEFKNSMQVKINAGSNDVYYKIRYGLFD